MDEYSNKLDSFLFPLVSEINEPVILELGVQNGISTKKFLEICKTKNGKLYSVDIDDCSEVVNDQNWKFFQTRDDNFEYIKSNINKQIDVLYIDTVHEAKHVKKIIYGYYSIVKENGYIFIDDISHLPYLKNGTRNNFYCEINNKETFNCLLEIYSENKDLFDLNFSFYSSGLAILKKKSNKPLNICRNLKTREHSLKNILRKIWKKMKKD